VKKLLARLGLSAVKETKAPNPYEDAGQRRKARLKKTLRELKDR